MKLEIISKYPVENQHPTPLLFVHGALHGAWCWDVHFPNYFTQNGYASHAVNLRGHGNSEGRENLRWTRIADFVEDVANTVEQLPSPLILIGHSMGGFMIQKYHLGVLTDEIIIIVIRPACCVHRSHLVSFTTPQPPIDYPISSWQGQGHQSHEVDHARRISVPIYRL